MSRQGSLFGLGCLVDKRAYKPDAYFGKGIGISDTSNYDLMKYGRFDLNQRSSQSCVWYSIAQRLWVDMQVHGKRKPELISPFAGYWATRRKTAAGGPIYDMGCRPGDAMEVLKEAGWAPWNSWEGHGQVDINTERYDLGLVNKEPPLDVFQAMADRQWVRDVRVDSFGMSRVADAQVLIAREHRMIGTGIVLDETFSEWKAHMGPWRRTRAAIGRHMVTLAAFEPGCFFAIGSYGADNAEGNVVQISVDTIASDETEPLSFLEVDYTKVPIL